jgi:methionyl-tRNA formyltransferase
MINHIKKIKIIFIGTPDFGLPSLQAILNDKNFEVIAIISQPDKKVGRKQIFTFSPIKTESLKHNILVLQPEKIKIISEEIKALNPDVIIVAAYAQIIPEEILNIPKYGCINIHGSLLPKYRGASCIPAAILNGDKKSGITIIKMDKGLDTGPILTQNEAVLDNYETSDSLYQKLSNLAPKILIETIKKFINKEIKPISQNNRLSSYVKMLKKEDGKIDWSQDAQFIERFIRAMHTWPGAYTYWQNKIIKIIASQNKIIKSNNNSIGQVFVSEKQIVVQCGQDAIILKNIQLEGKKENQALDFVKGYSDFINSTLG